jgi:hypothetical protein
MATVLCLSLGMIMSANALVGSMNCWCIGLKYFDIGLALRPYCVPGLRYLFSYGESAFVRIGMNVNFNVK